MVWQRRGLQRAAAAVVRWRGGEGGGILRLFKGPGARLGEGPGASESPARTLLDLHATHGGGGRKAAALQASAQSGGNSFFK